MKTWKEYKNEYASKSESNKEQVAQIEGLAELLSEVIVAREERGLSQAELAEMCGLKQSAISRLESLKATPQLDTLLKILSSLNLKISLTSTN